MTATGLRARGALGAPQAGEGLPDGARSGQRGGVSEAPIPPLSRETTIRRDADGRWFHEGQPVTHAAVARAFDAWVDRTEDGRYRLANEVNWAYVEIEGAPLFVDRASFTDAGLSLALSDGRSELLDPRTLRLDGRGHLYCQAREGRLAAKFRRRAMLDLFEAFEQDDAGSWLRAPRARWFLPVVEAPLEFEVAQSEPS